MTAIADRPCRVGACKVCLVRVVLAGIAAAGTLGTCGGSGGGGSAPAGDPGYGFGLADAAAAWHTRGQ
jgi:hypothetical protein